MRKLPTLKFTELWPLMHIGYDRDLNGTIVVLTPAGEPQLGCRSRKSSVIA